MGSDNIGLRASFALQAAQACMAMTKEPVDLTGAWGPFRRPKTVSDDVYVSRIALSRIRLLDQPITVVDSVSDVFDGERLTAKTYIIMPEVGCALRFHCGVDDDRKIQAQLEHQYANIEIARCELDAIALTRHPQFMWYAASRPAEAAVLKKGLSSGGFVVLDTAVKDFRQFERTHLHHPTPA